MLLAFGLQGWSLKPCVGMVSRPWCPGMSSNSFNLHTGFNQVLSCWQALLKQHRRLLSLAEASSLLMTTSTPVKGYSPFVGNYIQPVARVGSGEVFKAICICSFFAFSHPSASTNRNKFHRCVYLFTFHIHTPWWVASITDFVFASSFHSFLSQVSSRFMPHSPVLRS